MSLSQMPDFSSPEMWVSLLTLTFLEIVLGIDNIIFISISSSKLNDEEQKKATNIGMILAMALRIVLLFGVSWLVSLQDNAWFSLHTDYLSFDLTGQSFLLMLGGVFLLYKSTTEIHHKLEGDNPHLASSKKGKVSLSSVIVQITIINIVFSFDSILTAVGMTNGLQGALILMIIAVVISVGIMMAFAVPVGRFVNKNPTIQMLGLAFLILIGFMLIVEGGHLGHLEVMGTPVSAVPKGYLYFAIAFSLFVEFLNMRLRKKSPKHVELNDAIAQAKSEGLVD